MRVPNHSHQHMIGRHSTRDSVKFESYTWDRAKERAKDEADSITECQNYKLHKACPRDLCSAGSFIFNCSWCGFNLDTKCASKQDQEHHQTFKELTLLHFYHKHALKLCNVRKSHDIECLCCKQIISGSAYCCLECQFFIHESCKEIPKEVEHPFHPQHILAPQIMGHYTNCAACQLSIGSRNSQYRSIDGIGISCKECDFNLHVSCANPNRCARAIKHNCHEHNMYYFFVTVRWFSIECNKCHEKFLADEAFYRCVECNFNLHLECIPIPSVVMITQKHNHPLTLIDSVKDDNPLIQYLMDSNDKVDYSMDYYCDVCETPCNPRRHAYCCKECIYITHVECIISKVRSYLRSFSKDFGCSLLGIK
ncbi:hypothetical protein Dsin_024191 [Dipteronia sinensis]|uniref:DC1 domain-containing protein n=1 Tax=Dipteronia sinensis TaxID=43782 RepID=A0AAE0A677_9ROSI|nr:hypothetical protein Dsin_024191 [Dipteronia sinensis]